MITKVYELAGMAAGKLQTTFCGVSIELNFRNGLGAAGTDRAVLITSERFVQDAIECDPRFGKLIRLTKTYSNEADARNEFQQHGAPIMGETESRKTTEEIKAIEEERQQAEIRKKEEIREKRKQAKTAKEVAKKQAEETGSTETSPEEGIVFENTNEAMYFLIEKGENVTEENLTKLLEKYNAKIKA